MWFTKIWGGDFFWGYFLWGTEKVFNLFPPGGGEFSANQKKHLFMQNLWQGDFFAETPSTGGIPKINYLPLLKIFFPNFRLYSLTLKVY